MCQINPCDQHNLNRKENPNRLEHVSGNSEASELIS